MNHATTVFLSLALLCNFTACSLLRADSVDRSSDSEIKLGSGMDSSASAGQQNTNPNDHPTTEATELIPQDRLQEEVTAEESDIWSIEVSDGESATMSAPVRARLQAPNSEKIRPDSQSTSKVIPRTSAAELFWRMPQSTVTHYVIRFGYSPTELSEQVLVSVEELDEVSDEIQGLLYRFTLIAPRDPGKASQAEELYYRVQAFNKSVSSPATPLARAQLVSSN